MKRFPPVDIVWYQNTWGVNPTARECFTGTVFLDPPYRIGATTGRLARARDSILIRQVPGPRNQGVPLSRADRSLATVCGRFVITEDGMVLEVDTVQPRAF